jgi:glycosyltransferase involved in cell wall biosynthesis
MVDRKVPNDPVRCQFDPESAPGRPLRSGPVGVGGVATIIIATHDRPDFVHRAVASALAQTAVDIEVVVVDDASEPPFAADVSDPRLRVVRRDQGGGMCVARNDGLAAATGEWVMFLDDDDEIAPDLIERSLDVIASSTLPAPVSAVSTMAVVDEDGAELRRYVPASLSRGEHYLLAGRGDPRSKNSLVMPTALVRQIGGWDPDVDAWESDDFGIRLNAVCSFEAIDEPLYRMTAHRGARVSKRAEIIPDHMARTLAKHRDTFRQHPEGHAHYMGVIGMYHLQAGHWWPAVAWSLRAVRRNPRRPKLWTWAIAALVGPPGLRAYRAVRGRPGVRWSTLTWRRVRKYGRRLLVAPRAVVARPLERVTWRLLRRRAPEIERAAPAPGRALVMGIYRRRNADRIGLLVREARDRGWDVRLWALDETAAELAGFTVGTGPGGKFALLNRLLGAGPLEPYDWVVVTDDDVVLTTSGLAQLLSVCETAGFALAQPAHYERSHHSYTVNARRNLAVARLVQFVEIGPLFAVRGAWLDRVVPFPESYGMGFGLELEWADLRREGARLGVVDATPCRHLEPIGRGYREDAEIASYKSLVRTRGSVSLQDLQTTLGTWRPWRSRPPWQAET